MFHDLLGFFVTRISQVFSGMFDMNSGLCEIEVNSIVYGEIPVILQVALLFFGELEKGLERRRSMLVVFHQRPQPASLDKT